MNQRVAVAAIISAFASGSIAIAVSYRAWGADVAELRTREANVEAAVTMLDKSRLKTDDTIINLIDTFKTAETNLKAAVTHREWWCVFGFGGPERIWEMGTCVEDTQLCASLRSVMGGNGTKTTECISQPFAWCYRSMGNDNINDSLKCWDSPITCERASEMERASGRVTRGCARGK